MYDVRSTKYGFTLIEVLMTIVLLSFAALYVTANLNLQGIRLDAAARRVAMDVQYAQSLAMSTRSSTRYGIQFEISPTNRYTVYQGGATTPVKDPLTQLPFQLTLGTGDTQGVSIAQVSVPGGYIAIEFDVLGNPVNPMGRALSQAATIRLSQAPTGTKTIRIAPLSGKVTFQ